MIETAPAYAKINLSLDIVSKMADGYHNMKMVMQTVGLCDEITVECVPGTGMYIDAGLPYLPGDGRNIAVKAAHAFFGYTGISGILTRIRIKKNIPVCAGLGGGSADGACVLRILDKMFKTGLGPEVLKAIGGTVGSDVPFCVVGGTMLAEGKGDDLKCLPQIPRCHIVICKPSFSCSTPELFKNVRCDKIRTRPDTKGMIAALGVGDLKEIARRMYNVFEDVLPRGTRDIADIKSLLFDNGALGAAMTGSGPAVFGVFDDNESARNACERLGKDFRECFLTETREMIID